ncbi:methylated-DNA--[protein]-cysteine S-methyltransferase [Paenibacillus thalictri]|uniref:Methylated-DNA--protein-cysteine methyltransferase n=1 Tax=Paenibacillus thalictri TaxID=2527873 RepID=A0A4Q9DVL6_9BACL|nr:methylated-DNA--[protein]-cysteine S-methyltransferase [Paenibacillus thalictri]TBL81094.1 methylated-DNA--[protein]-cysteine S-methyltransferase [Paenibacillus thalictri]
MKATMKPTIYWSLLQYGGWRFYIAATEKGLLFVGSDNKPFSEVSKWAEARLSGSELVQDDEKLQPYAVQLTEYLQGERTSFTFPLDLRGTPFQLAVWDALCQIPYGATWSYSDIARSIQRPLAVRAVGAAIGANPVTITVPCHRVIGKTGALTGYRGGLAMKTRLLELEGASTAGAESKRHA